MKPQEIPESPVSEEEEPEPDGLDILRDISKQYNETSDEEGDILDANEEFPDERFQIARKYRLDEERLIKKLLKKEKDRSESTSIISDKLTDKDIVEYLRNEKIEDQPLELLMKFVDRLRENREKHSIF